MATEYKLSYTAEEIDEKLGKVDKPKSWNDLTDKPFGEEASVGDNIFDMSGIITEEVGDVSPKVYISDFDKNMSINGTDFVVEVNGVRYTSSYTKLGMSGSGSPGLNCIGNTKLIEGAAGLASTNVYTDTGEPFVICYVAYSGKISSLILYTKEVGEYDVKLFNATVTVKPMDEKFMPLLTSPNGTKYKLTVSDDGTLSAVIAE